MKSKKLSSFLIKFPYFLGIAADVLWAVGLFFPTVYGILVGTPDFNPDLQVRQIMRIGGILMIGWTILLIWAVQNPNERRDIILITLFPVVFGLTAVTLINVYNGNTYCIWILAKLVILIITALISYFLTGQKKLILN